VGSNPTTGGASRAEAVIRLPATPGLITWIPKAESMKVVLATAARVFEREAPVKADWISLTIALVALSALAGCSTPTASGYLADYDRLAEGQFLEEYWSDRSAIRAGGYSTIQLSEVSTDRIEDQKGITASECAELLRSSLVQGSLGNIVASPSGTGRIAQLDVAITNMDPGSAAARIFAGELGAGHAWVQIEGSVVDPKSGEVLASFAERRRSSGAIGFEDVGGDSGPSQVRRMVRDIAIDIRKEIDASFAQ
jgi:hypothetical protein